MCRVAVFAAFLLILAIPGVPIADGQSLGTPFTFDVDSTVDSEDASPGDGICADTSGRCTLRAAIMEANAKEGEDTVHLPAGMYTLTIEGQGEDASATGDLDVTDDVAIVGLLGDGGSAGLPIVQGCETQLACTGERDRVFHIDPKSAGVSVINYKKSDDSTRLAAAWHTNRFPHR